MIASCYAAINGGETTWSEGYRFLRADGTYDALYTEWIGVAPTEG